MTEHTRRKKEHTGSMTRKDGMDDGFEAAWSTMNMMGSSKACIPASMLTKEGCAATSPEVRLSASTL